MMKAMPEYPFQWSNLIHLSTNMWGEGGGADPDVAKTDDPEAGGYRPYLRFNMPLFREVTERMRSAGMNTVVLDLGDAVVWPSHPELAVRGAWSPDQLKYEISRLREKGMKVLPKLNFSAAHQAWLGDYSRMVSTPEYYRVCSDLIADAFEIFGEAELFHIGYDEELFPAAQKNYRMLVLRQGELWWHDLYFLAAEIERHGGRPWMFSDVIWHHRDEFRRRMPRSIVQSSWFYFEDFSRVDWDDEFAKGKEWRQGCCSLPAFRQMASWGYDQIPCGSNVYKPGSIAKLAAFLRDNVPTEHICGFMMAPWKPMTPKNREYQLSAIDQTAMAIAAWKIGKVVR